MEHSCDSTGLTEETLATIANNAVKNAILRHDQYIVQKEYLCSLAMYLYVTPLQHRKTVHVVHYHSNYCSNAWLHGKHVSSVIRDCLSAEPSITREATIDVSMSIEPWSWYEDTALKKYCTSDSPVGDLHIVHCNPWYKDKYNSELDHSDADHKHRTEKMTYQHIEFTVGKSQCSIM